MPVWTVFLVFDPGLYWLAYDSVIHPFVSNKSLHMDTSALPESAMLQNILPNINPAEILTFQSPVAYQAEVLKEQQQLHLWKENKEMCAYLCVHLRQSDTQQVDNPPTHSSL